MNRPKQSIKQRLIRTLISLSFVPLASLGPLSCAQKPMTGQNKPPFAVLESQTWTELPGRAETPTRTQGRIILVWQMDAPPGDFVLYEKGKWWNTDLYSARQTQRSPSIPGGGRPSGTKGDYVLLDRDASIGKGDTLGLYLHYTRETEPLEAKPPADPMLYFRTLGTAWQSLALDSLSRRPDRVEP